MQPLVKRTPISVLVATLVGCGTSQAAKETTERTAQSAIGRLPSEAFKDIPIGEPGVACVQGARTNKVVCT